MKYISIGAVMTEGTEHNFVVCRGSNKFTLTGDLAAAWLGGRLGFAVVNKPEEEKAAQQLIRMGLAVISRDYNSCTLPCTLSAICHPALFDSN